MSEPKFDIKDHFKGKFSKEPTPSKYLKGSFDGIKGYFNDVGVFIGSSPFYWEGTIPTIVEFSKAHDPDKFDTEISGTFECEHIPIDVGFNSVKLVCKKCDKDL